MDEKPTSSLDFGSIGAEQLLAGPRAGLNEWVEGRAQEVLS